MRREICGECGAPINDDGSCDCTELLERGWRRCAVGQKTTQWCAMAETLLREQKQRDETLLRQVLTALEQIATDLPWELTGLQADAIAALRERLEVSNG